MWSRDALVPHQLAMAVMWVVVTFAAWLAALFAWWMLVMVEGVPGQHRITVAADMSTAAMEAAFTLAAVTLADTAVAVMAVAATVVATVTTK